MRKNEAFLSPHPSTDPLVVPKMSRLHLSLGTVLFSPMVPHGLAVSARSLLVYDDYYSAFHNNNISR
jgi:hypothetical protein